MSKVGIVFYSAAGTTLQLANAVAEGCALSESEPIMCQINNEDIHHGRFTRQSLINELSGCEAIIFGSPTYMGSVTAQFKAFADATSELWTEQRWRDKFAAGFTIGTNLSGDQLNTLQYFHILASQHGMIWVGLDVPGGYDAGGRNRLGAQSGLVAQTSTRYVEKADLITARYLGARVGRLVRRVEADLQRQLWQRSLASDIGGVFK